MDCQSSPGLISLWTLYAILLLPSALFEGFASAKKAAISHQMLLQCNNGTHRRRMEQNARLAISLKFSLMVRKFAANPSMGAILICHSAMPSFKIQQPITLELGKCALW